MLGSVVAVGTSRLWLTATWHNCYMATYETVAVLIFGHRLDFREKTVSRDRIAKPQEQALTNSPGY